MIKCEVVILEDDLEYVIVNKVEHNGETYLYLVDKDTAKNLCIKKLAKDNGEDFIIPLDSVEEFELALKLFKDINQ